MFRDCPKEQVRHCLYYEFARERSEIRKWMDWAIRGFAEGKSIADLLENFSRQPASQYPTRLFYTTTGAFLANAFLIFPSTLGWSYRKNSESSSGNDSGNRGIELLAKKYLLSMEIRGFSFKPWIGS
jgi:hypothetical protein